MKIQNIKKRNGEVVPFVISKIQLAIEKAFLATTKDTHSDLSKHISEMVAAELALMSMNRDNLESEYVPQVERVQDIVEQNIMKAGFFDVAKEYIIYRYEHNKIRTEKKIKNAELAEEGGIRILSSTGKKEIFDIKIIDDLIDYLSNNFIEEIGKEKYQEYKEEILGHIKLEVFDGMSSKDLLKNVIMNMRVMIEMEPVFSKIAAKLILHNLYKEVLGREVSLEKANLDQAIKTHFPKYIRERLALNKFDPRMGEYDLEDLAQYLYNDRDNLFEYMGMEVLISRYFISDINTGKEIETPQMFWMRIAMGIAINEPKQKRQQMAKDFYDSMSQFYYTPGGRTLYQSGVSSPQLSNCFINEVTDDLVEIFRMYGDNAQLLKWSGGVGTSWSKVRATGALVKSVEITSQGVIPYLKISNDINVCIMRSGKRRAAAVVYLETWHADIEDFIESRKNTGDERRRLHDINTANWIPDLFMKRVREDKEWSLFSPDETPELNDLYGKKFEAEYIKYEKLGQEGKLKVYRKLAAKDLWKKMLAMLFETGHPWITFKDPSNIRNPQDHVGVIHSSNLCTEIMLNTSKNETAVCILGSINVEKFIKDNGDIDDECLEKHIYTSIRMLDNVVDINFYPTEDSKNSNMRSRPVGLGLRGYHDALYKKNILFDSQEAVDFSDIFMEKVSYYSIKASALLAQEKGAYETFKGSKWDRNIFPIDSIELLEQERGMGVLVNRDTHMDWSLVRELVKKYGMRNSNTMAIAPTASTANLVGCIPTIEPIYKNIYVKSNKHGEFTIVNKYMVSDLKKLNLWNRDMLQKVKFNGGSVQNILEIPLHIRSKYKEVFDIDQRWLLRAAAVRGKWIDQSQSINMFYKGVSGKEISDLYMYAWELGLKTTYYLRTLGASTVEKSTVQVAGNTTHDQRSNSNTNNTNANNISNMSINNTNIDNIDMSNTNTVIVGSSIISPVANISNTSVAYNIYKAESQEECEGCSA